MPVSQILAAHPRHVGLASLAVGLLLSGAPVSATVAGALAGLLLAVWTGRLRLAVTAAALVVAGALIGSARLEAIDHSELGRSVGHGVAVRGYLVKRERPTRSAHRARLRLTALREPGVAGRWRRVNDTVQVQARKYLRLPDITIGDEVELRGVLDRPVHRPGDDFDYAAYLRRSGVHGLLEADSIRLTGRRRGGLAGFIDRLRRRAERGVGAGLGGGLAALARGMVLGQDERIPRDMADQFKRSGLAHLLAVSGQNVTLLALLALPALAALGLERRARFGVLLGLIAVYVPLTGAGPSIMRAGAMGAAGAVAAVSGRPASRWYGVLLAGAFTLALDPRAWQDAGWQLSFAAVIGIFWLVPGLRRALGRLPEPLAAGAAVTLAATVATAPLMAFHFGRISVVSLVANLIALPAVAPIMWLGMLAAAVAQVWVEPAALLNGLNGYCLAYLAEIARWSAGLPGALWPVHPGSPLGLIGVYGVLAAVVVLIQRTPQIAGSRLARKLGPGRVAVASLATLAAAVWVLWPGVPRPPDRFAVSFLDVGQGDATLIQAPDRVAVLVDGGPPDADLVGKLREAGVRSVDLVVLTHPQADHQGGLESLVHRLPVDLLLDGGSGTRDPTHSRIVALARRHGTRVVAGRAGEVFRIGKLRLRVLSPEGGFAADTSAADINDRALVLLVSYGALDAFLPADAESNVTATLPLRAVEVMKVAHHGSEDDGLPALLKRVRPQVAVIEVGAHNRYGHPRPETLAALRARVPDVYRTDRDGDVRVELGSDGPVVSTEH